MNDYGHEDMDLSTGQLIGILLVGLAFLTLLPFALAIEWIFGRVDHGE